MHIKTPLQRVIVSASSAAYLSPCYHYYATHDHAGAILFGVITIMSIIADGGWLMENDPIMRRMDRCTATIGGIYAAIPKLWPYVHPNVTLHFMLCSFICLTFLNIARRTSNMWNWVAWQTIWHISSASMVVNGVYCSQNGDGCFIAILGVHL